MNRFRLNTGKPRRYWLGAMLLAGLCFGGCTCGETPQDIETVLRHDDLGPLPADTELPESVYQRAYDDAVATTTQDNAEDRLAELEHAITREMDALYRGRN